jgi:hypothetical protein
MSGVTLSVVRASTLPESRREMVTESPAQAIGGTRSAKPHAGAGQWSEGVVPQNGPDAEFERHVLSVCELYYWLEQLIQ